ncbi:MAG TPA: DUF3105 domain-containing protein [Anaerolineales bacterium]|nr:DUF3105 domain-containing protein [Anaerolineales bacterium]
MGRTSMREQRRARQRRQQTLRRLLWAAGGLVVLVAVGWLASQAFRPGVGQSVETSPAGQHVPEGTDPGEYSTDPPTSGVHFPSTFDAGFYAPGDAASLPSFPAAYLVHNLEHGYVIYWYNCGDLAPEACSRLQSSIQDSMREAGSVKLIAFPWESISEQVVLTSWGKILRLETFDPDQAEDFIRANRYRAPEPNGA